jgi:enoyl-CoA hydratase/carnithine racemase
MPETTVATAASQRTVYLERRGDSVVLMMNRPHVLNAEDWALIEDLHAAISEIESSDVRAVIVAGSGRAFSSGIDLTALADGRLSIEWFRRFDEAVRRLECLDALTVARIHGYAIGGGLLIALGCDLRVAADDAKVGLPAVLEALVPGMGTYRLGRFVGLGRARRMTLTGDLLSAAEAQAVGLIDWAVPAADLEVFTDDVIARVLRGSATARRLAKQLVTASFERDYDAAFAAYLPSQAQCLASAEHRVAMAHYLRQRSQRVGHAD